MKLEDVTVCLNKIAQPSILVIGDLMIDEYLWGNVERISPEAPVQVVDVQREAYALGGAGNVVNNLVSLGAKVYIASVIGCEANARLLKQEFEKLGVNMDGLFEHPSRLTIKKTRIFALSQQVLRIDRENRHPIEPYWEQKIINYVADNIHKFDGIIASDYLPRYRRHSRRPPQLPGNQAPLDSAKRAWPGHAVAAAKVRRSRRA